MKTLKGLPFISGWLLVCWLTTYTSAVEPWDLNTFPGPGHKEHSGDGSLEFPPGQGADRTEQVSSFGVSPHEFEEGWWILYTTDLGHLDISTNGKPDELARFSPSTFPFIAPKLGTFHPHSDGDLSSGTELWAYVIATKRNIRNDNGNSGMWRTRDKGQTWEQVYSEPNDDASEIELAARPTGDEVIVDPHPDRSGHVYYAHYSRGLLRNKLAGSETNPGKVPTEWESIAFDGFRVKHIAAEVSGETTVLWMVARLASGPADAPGALFRMEFTGSEGFYDQPESEMRIHDGRVTTIRPNPGDPDSGFLLVDGILHRYALGPDGYETTQIHFGEVRGESIKISPEDPDHIITGKGSASDTMVSFDGGVTWKGGIESSQNQRPFDRVLVAYDDGSNPSYQNEYLPDIKVFGPINWRGDNPNLGSAGKWAIDLTGAERNNFRVDGWGMGGPGAGEHAYAFLPGTGDAENPMWVGQLGMSFMRGFKVSKNGGVAWVDFGYGTQQKRSNQVAFGPDEAVIGVGRDEHGLQITRDGGLSWRTLTYTEDPTIALAVLDGGNEFSSKSCYGVAFDPDDPDRILLLQGRVLAEGKTASVLFSTNFGTSWAKALSVDATAQGIVGRHSAHVFWRKASGKEQIYVEHFRCDDPDNPLGSWTDIGHQVLHVHPEDPDFILGTRSSTSGSQGAADYIVSLSLDGGDNWTPLPALPKEVSFSTSGGVFSLRQRTVNSMETRKHQIAIDPSDEHNPGLNMAHPIRLLLAGRSGIYEYQGAPGSPEAGDWILLNNVDFDPYPDSGQLGDDDVNTVDAESRLLVDHPEAVGARPYMDQVIFDPGAPHIVYAFNGSANISANSNRNPNVLTGLNPMSRRFVYRSTDGGRTWTPLHGLDFPGLNAYNRIVGIPAIGSDGTLAFSNTTGLYRFSRNLEILKPDNLPPQAVDDAYSVGASRGALNIAEQEGLLGNDEDPDGDGLQVLLPLLTDARHGDLQVNADGSFTYVPDSGFEGVDFFRYQVQDSEGNLSSTVALGVIDSSSQNELIHYWKLDEIAGGAAEDNTDPAFAVPAILKNTTFEAASVPAVWGNGLAFNGVDTWLDTGSSNALKAAFTSRGISMHFRANRLQGFQTLFNEGGSVKGIGLRLNGPAVEARVLEAGKEPLDLASEVPVREGIWYHLALSFNGELRQAELYLTPSMEGFPLLVDTATEVPLSGVGAHGNPSGLAATNDDDVWGENSNGGAVQFLHGDLDEVRLYDRPLSFEDVDLLLVENKDRHASDSWSGTIWRNSHFPEIYPGWKLTDHGWIYDAAYPIIFLSSSPDSGSYFYVSAAVSSPTSIYLYDFARNEWKWTRVGIGPWAYTFSSDSWSLLD